MYFSHDEVSALWQACNRGASGPVLIKQPFSRPIASDDALLRVLQAWGDDVRRGRAPAPDIDYIDARVLPQREDATLSGCIDRIERAWSVDWFAYVNDLHQYDGDVWERALEVLEPAIRRNGGLPAGGFRIEGFFGRYGSTPTGIHLDSSDNFSFIVRGPKRLLFWPHHRFQARVRKPDPRAPAQEMALTRDWQPHVADAIVIDAEQGDVVYWPKAYWHVGSSPEGWTAMVNLAMWWNASPLTLARFVLDRVVDLDGEPRQHPFDLNEIPTEASTLPPTLQEAIQGATEQIATRSESVARLVWASVATSYGFTTPPGKLPAPALTDSMRVRARHPVVPLATPDGCVVAACGHRLRVSIPNLKAGCDRLNESYGEAFPVGIISKFLVGEDADAEARAQCRGLIAELVACRALDVVHD